MENPASPWHKGSIVLLCFTVDSWVTMIFCHSIKAIEHLLVLNCIFNNLYNIHFIVVLVVSPYYASEMLYMVSHFPKRRSNMACSGSHSFKDQWACILAFGGFSGKQSPVGRCAGPHSWSYYFSWCAALTFSARSTMDRKRDDWHRDKKRRENLHATEWRMTAVLC